MMQHWQPVMSMTTRPARRVSSAGHICSVLVLGAILILCSCVGVLKGKIEESKIQLAKADLAAIRTSLEMFHLQYGKYPSHTEGLRALVDNGLLSPDKLMDPWRHRYAYTYPGKLNPRGFDLLSAGPDGFRGSVDDISL